MSNQQQQLTLSWVMKSTMSPKLKLLPYSASSFDIELKQVKWLKSHAFTIKILMFIFSKYHQTREKDNKHNSLNSIAWNINQSQQFSNVEFINYCNNDCRMMKTDKKCHYNGQICLILAKIFVWNTNKIKCKLNKCNSSHWNITVNHQTTYICIRVRSREAMYFNLYS